MLSFLARSWRGETSLAAAFWLVYFLFGLILSLIVSIIFKMGFPHINYLEYRSIIAAICFPYTLFSIVCVWRSAKNSSAFWRIIARIIVILSLIFGFLNLWIIVRPPHIPVTAPGPVIPETRVVR